MSYSSFGAEPVVTKSPSQSQKVIPLTTCQEVQAAAELTELLFHLAHSSGVPEQSPKVEGIVVIQAAGHALGCPPKWAEVETTSDGRIKCTPEHAAAAMAAATSYPGLPQGTLEAINVVCGASPIAPAPAQASTTSGKSNFLPIALLVGGVALAVLVLGKKK